MIEAKNLTKKYGDDIGVLDLNLSIGKGEIYCLLGQNGAGKTTTINLFLGLLKPTSGQALIEQRDVFEHKAAVNKLLAYIPEVVQLYGNLNAIENLTFFSRLAGYKLSTSELYLLLDRVGLQREVHQKKLSTFSKGMRQKVGVAIALSKQAKVIFMDEPTSGLDPKATNEFTTICKELATEGKTILMSTHDIFNAVNVGSSIGVMKKGQLVYATKTDKVNAHELQELYLKTI